nr:hypothetical protein [Tanacetum cinerariifolium]
RGLVVGFDVDEVIVVDELAGGGGRWCSGEVDGNRGEHRFKTGPGRTGPRPKWSKRPDRGPDRDGTVWSGTSIVVAVTTCLVLLNNSWTSSLVEKDDGVVVKLMGIGISQFHLNITTTMVCRHLHATVPPLPSCRRSAFTFTTYPTLAPPPPFISLINT